MIVGIPKEIKNNENRVGMTDVGVAQLVADGHRVLVETQAGVGSGIADHDFSAAGAEIIETATDVFAQAEMIIKVKEPLAAEYPLLRENQILYTYLHLAAEPALANLLCERRVSAVAYETIEAPDGSLPLLTPMSEVAGRMATQIGAQYLQKDHTGKGILLGGVTGVRRGRVTIIGGGVVGLNAAYIAVGLGAEVTILDVNRARLEYLDHIFHGRVQTLYSNAANVAASVATSDLVIGAVLVTGSKAPVIVSDTMIRSMASGSVVVDVAVDQGGCVETCRPTSHDDPVFVINGVIHYCVPNMPGVVPRTSTYALTSATLAYARMIAAKGLEEAVCADAGLSMGMNTLNGQIVYAPVAQALRAS